MSGPQPVQTETAKPAGRNQAAPGGEVRDLLNLVSLL
jgi:hypothetical protein